MNKIGLHPPPWARGFIISLALAALLGAVVDGVFGTRWLPPWDARVAAWFHSFRSPGLTRVMTLVSWLGDPRLLIVASVVLGALLLTVARWREFLTAGAILAGGATLYLFLKTAFQRPRPDGVWLAAADGYSFPSGHAFGAVLFYGVLAYLGARMVAGRPAPRYLYIAVCLVIIFSVGVSRVYLGVHFMSDVLGGWIAGALWFGLCLTLAHWLRLESCRP